MRSLDSVNVLRQNYKKKRLPTLQQQQSPVFSLKSQSKCAFHLAEKITNFCKDPDCLLPLCPKCIKIHSQEHAEIGTLACFQPIEQCMKEAHQYFASIFEGVAHFQKQSWTIEDAYKARKQNLVEELRAARNYAINQMMEIFQQFEKAILEDITKQDQRLTNQLIQHHDLLGQILDEARDSVQKFSSRQLTMEGLITFYNRHNAHQKLQEIGERLGTLSSSNISIRVNEEALVHLRTIVKRYLSIGEDLGTLENYLARTPHAGSSRQVDSRKQQPWGTYFSHKSLIEDRIKAESQINSFESALNSFSVAKSRNVRRNLKRRQQNQDQQENDSV